MVYKSFKLTFVLLIGKNLYLFHGVTFEATLGDKMNFDVFLKCPNGTTCDLGCNRALPLKYKLKDTAKRQGFT